MINVLMIAAENDALPKGKVGGVGDVIRDVPQFLARQNIKVAVITPGYRYHSEVNPARLIKTFKVPFQNSIETVELFQLDINGEANVTQWVLEHDIFANAGKGKIYCDDGPSRPFASDATKFAFFCGAVCELLCDDWKDQFNVIHLHDWHAAFVAILRAYEPKYSALKSIKCVYTIHNLALQGTRPLRGDQSSLENWFPKLDYNERLIADPNYSDCVNPARAGINLSDVVHAVSPTYAKEILHVSQVDIGKVGGEGLEKDLQKIAAENRLFGILNGCDYTLLDTTSSSELSGKSDKSKLHTDSTVLLQLLHQAQSALMGLMSNQRLLLSSHFIAMERIGQWKNEIEQRFRGPLITSIGRLTDQKVKLLLLSVGQHRVLDELLKLLAKHQGVLIVVGSGDAEIECQFNQAMVANSNLLFINGYCEQLPEQLYQLGDLFLMPSSLEPCGISQMQAMRAGQACLVHQTGGLADTVNHLKTGFSFSGKDNQQKIQAMLKTFEAALTLFDKDKKQWQKIANNAAKQRFLWQDSVKQYISKLYQ